MPVEGWQAERSPVEWSPVEWSPVEVSPVEWSPVEVSPVEWSPVEGSQAEWSPVEGSQAEWSPVEGWQAERSPVEWSPIEWSPVEVSPVEGSQVWARETFSCTSCCSLEFNLNNLECFNYKFIFLFFRNPTITSSHPTPHHHTPPEPLTYSRHHHLTTISIGYMQLTLAKHCLCRARSRANSWAHVQCVILSNTWVATLNTHPCCFLK